MFLNLIILFARWLVSVGKTDKALKVITMASKQNKLPAPEYIPTDDSQAEDMTNTGILGLMRHKTLFIRLIIMSLEWIGKITKHHII